jgi:N-acetylglucosaminyldiphosphoundecaprenol N-acetyl-beta-D-mannosaminyltransferase
MPFILVSTGSLSSLLLLAKHELSNFSESMCLSVLACALIFMVYSSTGKRALAGNAGLAAWGLLTGLISLQGNSEQLIVLSLLIPSMVVIFPPALVSFLLVTSYLGNNLHRKPDRNFSWSLRREQVVVFTGLIFLCLNFLVILVEFDSPAYGYIALGLLLVAALTGFFKTFARKIVDKKNDYTQIQILDSHIDAICLNEVLQKIKKHIADPQRQNLMHIITADSLAVLRSNEDDFFKTVMKRAELVIPDGAGIIWAADFLGQPLPERIPGVSLVTDIASLSTKQKFKLFFLGGKPGIAQKAAENLRNQFSDLEIVGIRHGYFVEGSAEEDEIMQQICQSKADVVFVALGVPRQERFISKFRLTKHKAVALGVGGSFDVISQTLPRAPEWMQRFAIEWLFRLWLEPFRINRIAKIPAFVLRVLRYKWNQS